MKIISTSGDKRVTKRSFDFMEIRKSALVNTNGKNNNPPLLNVSAYVVIRDYHMRETRARGNSLSLSL